MKKIVLVISLFFIGIGAMAQYQAGNILLSGTLVFGSGQSKDISGGVTVDGPKTTTFEIGPGIEYFFSDKIAFGIDLGYGMEKEVEEDGGVTETDKISMTTIAPFASMYFINEEKFALFCKLGVGFGFGKDIYEEKGGGTTVTDETKISALEVGLKPGIAVHLSEKFGMTATFGAVGFRSMKWEYDNFETKTSGFGLEIKPSLGFGIYYKFR